MAAPNGEKRVQNTPTLTSFDSIQKKCCCCKPDRFSRPAEGGQYGVVHLLLLLHLYIVVSGDSYYSLNPKSDRFEHLNTNSALSN